MASPRIHDLITFRRLFRLLLGIVVVFQFALITFNHLSGYYTVESLRNFFDRLVYSSFLSLVAGFLIAYPNLAVISYLNRHHPWSSRPISRIPIQLALTILIGVSIAVGITLLANTINSYEQPLQSVLILNSLIVVVINIFLMAILEGWIIFSENQDSKRRAEELERELTSIRFEVLKQQINPHFMFNSLNVLSGLIDTDSEKAQQFIDEFSSIYRYVLQTIEQSVVTLGEELDFIRSYIFLQEIRYGENLKLSINIPSALLSLYLPPLSLQLVLENAIKHNVISAAHPLYIDIYHEDNTLVIRNNVQRKQTSMPSTRLGLSNLAKRYAMVCNTEPVFMEKKRDYMAILPLIHTDEDESSNH